MCISVRLSSYMICDHGSCSSHRLCTKSAETNLNSAGAAWDLVADIFYEPRRSGRPRADDRLMLNGGLWVLCSGAAWRDMPERFGPWLTVYQRLRDWRNRGAFDQML